MKLLLAEDDPEPAEHIVDALQGRAHTVRDVGDGTEGLGRPLMGEYAALIVDCMLTGMDG